MKFQPYQLNQGASPVILMKAIFIIRQVEIYAQNPQECRLRNAPWDRKDQAIPIGAIGWTNTAIH